MFNPDGIVLVRKCYITCVNLLFSNSRVQSYIKKGRLLDLRTEVQTVPPDEDVVHVGNAPVRRRWVQLRTSPAVKVVLYKERVRREQAVSAELSNTAHVYCVDVMCNGNMLSCATGIRISLENVIMCGLIQIMICQK